MGEAELAFPTLDFESEKLEATRNVHNPGLRLIERYAEVFENPHRSGQGVLRLGPSPTGHYPVIRPSRELVPLSPHLLIKPSHTTVHTGPYTAVRWI